MGIIYLYLVGLKPAAMKLPPPPELLKYGLIIFGVIALIGLILMVLTFIAGIITIQTMFPHSRGSAQLPVNQYQSEVYSPPVYRNPPATVVTPPLTNNDNRSQSPKKAMTWRVLNTATIGGKKYALFGSDNLTNPYQGDTDINEVRSLLCIQKNNLPAPLGLPKATTTPGGASRGSWSGGRVLIIPNVQASTLTSQVLADEKCRLQGLQVTGENGFRMAEFHDGDQLSGWAGWDFWAEVSSIEGLDNSDTRYWVQINDQRANPW
jgi:hypothetical protein